MSRKLQLALIGMMVLLFSALGCHKLECENDEDCPHHMTCVGSSVCPDDVVCVWEGEPGLCLPTNEERLCTHTGGDWDENSCGHYACGDFPGCDAVIPGCDCGPDANFADFRGCVEDLECTGGCYADEDCEEGLVCSGARLAPEHPTHPKMGELPLCMWNHDRPGECVSPEVAACEETGGTWDETSCGDYECGERPLCEAIIPGCDCGPRANYVEGEGCVKDLDCPGVCQMDEDCREDQICWSPMQPEPHVLSTDEGADCTALDCGLGTCIDPDRALCRMTGGSWDEMRCGHSSCQSDVTCLAIIPGCDCGSRASWVEGEGCVEDPECKPILCSREMPCPDELTCVPPPHFEEGWTPESSSVFERSTKEYGVCKRIPRPL